MIQDHHSYNLDMIVWFIFAVVVLVACYLYYLLAYHPKALMKEYKIILENLGYSVELYPYVLLGRSLTDQMKEDTIKYGDKFYTLKRRKSPYDIGITNLFNRVVIQVYTPELIQEFLSPQSPYLFHKI